MDLRIKKIIDKWYLTEPALLMTILAHEMVANPNMSCPFRCGKGVIELNPELIKNLSDSQLENSLKAEAIRIILKHPYERQPDGCRRKSMALGSNLVLGDNYDFSDINIPKPSDYNLPENESYEWYSMRIEGNKLIPEDSNNPVNNNSENDIASHSDNEDNGIDKEELESNCNSDNFSSDSDNNNDGPDDIEASSDKYNNDQEESSNNPSTSDQQNSSANTAQNNESEDDFYVLTLADGTTMRISKGKPSCSQDLSKDNETEDANSDGTKSAQNEGDNHPEENRKFDGNQKKAETKPKKPTPPSEDLSSLWEEDSLMACTVDAIIEDIQSSGSGWGSLAGSLVEEIIANTKARIDYRKTLSGFRASILSSKRHLTRMRPNRRSGFDNMGSIRRFDTNLLIAVDVSGSISDEVLTHFYSVIGRIFKYGIEHVDVVQFDCSFSEVQSFEKAKKRINIVGRGGTSFQPIFDYVHKNIKYDGLIIFTDGYAPKPKKPKGFRTKVVWVCQSEKTYEEHKPWMKETGRCCYIKL